MDGQLGSPVAIELLTADAGAARAFYTGLLGWAPADDAGGEVACTLDGVATATIRGGRDPARWRLVLAGDDAARVAASVSDAGGALHDVSAALVVAADPNGAGFAVACDGPHDRLRPGTGRVSWFELMTSDPASSDDFYAAVFGWTASDPEGGEAATARYALYGGAAEPVAGRLALSGELAQAVGDRWMIYVAVHDVDPAVELVTTLGGRVVVGPMDAPTGRVAAVCDPGGAMFTLITPRMHADPG